MASKKPPQITDELIAYLAETFRNELPRDVQFDTRDVSAMVGEQRVIFHLKHLHATQSKGQLLSE